MTLRFKARARAALLLLPLTLLAASATVLSAPAVARAQHRAALSQSGGWDLHLYRPAVDSKGILSVNGTDILGANAFSFGLIMDAGFGLLPYDGFRNDNTAMNCTAGMPGCSMPLQRTGRLVDYSFTGTLHFNYGFANLFIVGIQVPVHVLGGQNIGIRGDGTPENVGGYNDRAFMDTKGLNAQALGNITLHTKFRLLRVERDAIGLAAILNLELPTGDPGNFAGEPGFVAWPQVAAEWRPVRQLRVAANIGARLHFGSFSTHDGDATLRLGGASDPMGANGTFPVARAGVGNNVHYGQILNFGLGLSLRVATPIDLVVEAYGNQLLSDAPSTSLEVMGGIKIFVDRSSYLVIGGGGGIPIPSPFGFNQADVRAMLGFIFEPSIGDRDGDGLRDDVDHCPDQPEDFDNFADEDGCPDPDNDRDGIPDVDDECPLVPEDRDGDHDEDGCPEGNEGDRDGDGIADTVDQCPDDPEDRDNFQDEDGCPDPDNDNDQILDSDDLCPNDPEDRDQFQDQDGCPDPDNDNDRILDVHDACPNDPETYNGYQDDDGCPDRGSVVIEENQIVILEKIYFETDSAVIQDRSHPILDAIAATLNGNPQIRLIEIQGHADERATDDYNVRLTRDRAASVLEAVVQRGVVRDRLHSGGYGERCPTDPRHNETAWDANRRVEFKILVTDSGPTGVEIACPAGRDLIPEDDRQYQH